MPSLRTEVTEIVTGLAMLGLGDVDWALAARPASVVGVTEAHWHKLAAARHDPAHQLDFASAWANGLAFLHASEGLRGRPPIKVEWRGPDKLPAMADVPADLRVDLVYLVSCKYLSKILVNSSPAGLFDGGLGERRAEPVADWYEAVAPDEYAAFYAAAVAALGVDPPADPADPASRVAVGEPGGSIGHDIAPGPSAAGLTSNHVEGLGAGVSSAWPLPGAVAGLDRAQRDHLRRALRGPLPVAVEEPYHRFAHAVADRSTRRWKAALPDLASRERLLWRMLRIGGAPYFVLGSSPDGGSLRLRIDTPWDWRQRYRLRAFEVWGEAAGQPLVRWQASVADRELGHDRTVKGHVEVRWSHGRFNGAPEAKVYLDSPHAAVPGYQPLV